jgi:hypothetical protein
MAGPVFYLVSVAQVPVAVLNRDTRVEKELEKSHEVKLGLDGKTPGAWLFQSNPVLYDLRGALRSLAEQVWSVSRYAKEIRTGDRVYLWEAGSQGGIAAIAEIIEPASLQPEPPEQIKFARVAEAFHGERLRARLRILQVIEPVLDRKSIVTCPGLNELALLRCPRGTNFRLTLNEWHALNGLIHGTATT